jgi:N-glycosidase YbiA
MIKFYSHTDPYGCFSNFSRHRVGIYERNWSTSESAFQAMKFQHRPDIVDKVFLASTPGQAAKMGRERSFPLRPDWDLRAGKEMLSRIKGDKSSPLFNPEDCINRMGVPAEPVLHRVKDVIMYEVVFAKFIQNEEIQKELLGTGNQELVEAAEFDPYWGWGCSRCGLNKLGRILMIVRSALQLRTGEGEGEGFHVSPRTMPPLDGTI